MPRKPKAPAAPEAQAQEENKATVSNVGAVAGPTKREPETEELTNGTKRVDY